MSQQEDNRRAGRERVIADYYQTKLKRGEFPTYDSVRREVEKVADKRDKVRDWQGGKD